MNADPKERIERERAWVERYAESRGLAVNPVAQVTEKLLLTMAENLELYGRRICPCREATWDPEADRLITCPCDAHLEEIAEQGTCHCTLFGRRDLTAAEWSREIERLMAEFSLDRTVAPETIDARGLTCPGPVFLTKREFVENDPAELRVLVDSEASVRNLKGLGARYGRAVQVREVPEGHMVELRRTEVEKEALEE